MLKEKQHSNKVLLIYYIYSEGIDFELINR